MFDAYDRSRLRVVEPAEAVGLDDQTSDAAGRWLFDEFLRRERSGTFGDWLASRGPTRVPLGKEVA